MIQQGGMLSVVTPGQVLAEHDIEKQLPSFHKCPFSCINKVWKDFFKSDTQQLSDTLVKDIVA